MGSPLADLVDRYAELAAAMASLTARTAIELAGEALDALGGANQLRRPGGRDVVESELFASPLPGAALELVGPLVNGHASDTLPRSAVTVEATPDATGFRLRAVVTGHRGATYWGSVATSAPSGSAPVPVWITVP